MDSSHVSLCALKLRAAGFDHYRCDKNISLGVNTPNLSKILRCAGNDDLVTIKSEEETDTLNMMFESPNQVSTARDWKDLITNPCIRKFTDHSRNAT